MLQNLCRASGTPIFVLCPAFRRVPCRVMYGRAFGGVSRLASKCDPVDFRIRVEL